MTTETLGQKQRRFTGMIAQLIAFAYASGYELTPGDAYRDPHTVTLPEAKVVAATIGAAYQQQLGAKQAALRDIDPDAPDAKSQIEAVSFSGFHSTKG